MQLFDKYFTTIHKDKIFAILLLVLALLLRGLLLEYSDLVDPTETRYASVAQEMVILRDWVTPRLPTPEGVVPYMGKPPLHFWLTAIAYEIFGIDEWTARLPSYLSSFIILLVVGNFSQKLFGGRVGALSALIAFSSGMLFFLAGASVTDVTLTALVSVSIYYLYLHVSQYSKKSKFAYFSAIFQALAFLTKGPVALVLVWFPFFLWGICTKNFKWLKALPWSWCIIIFLVITTPWFIYHEISNPGALKYFFWNENLARYLFKEYGDKYGSGHVHTYGASWLMLFAGFAPWSLILSYRIYSIGWRSVISFIKSDPNLLFSFLWGISAAVFFTFVRQLHPMYILPSIPGMAVFSAKTLLSYTEDSETRFKIIESKRYQYICLAIIVIMAGVGAILAFSAISLIFSCLLIYGGGYLFKKISIQSNQFSKLQLISLQSFILYLVVIISFTPYIDLRRSSGELLEDLADLTIHENGIPQVGVVTRNGYSFFWISKTWKNELSRELSVQFVKPSSIPNQVRHIILRSEDVLQLSKNERSEFSYIMQRGKWQLFSRRVEPISDDI